MSETKIAFSLRALKNSKDGIFQGALKIKSTRMNPSLGVLLGVHIGGHIGEHIEVGKVLGPGSLKSVHEKVLYLELAEQRIPFERQKEWIIRSRIFFGSFSASCVHSRSLTANKDNIEYAQ